MLRHRGKRVWDSTACRMLLKGTTVDSTAPGNSDYFRDCILTNSDNSSSLHSEIDLKRRAIRSAW
jgi:hypothetical protein